MLVGITYGIQPYGNNSMGWESPVVLGEIIGGLAMLLIFLVIETRVAEPMFRLSLFKIREFTAGNVAGLLVSVARGGIQFMLIIWLQGIWLPLHGYSYDQTPLWAGIFLLPMTAGFLVSGPTSGILSDRFGSRGIATAGMAVFASSFIALMLLPVNFPYWAFALFIAPQRDRQRHVRLAELLLHHGLGPGHATGARPPACAPPSRTRAPRCPSASCSR